MQEFQEIAPDEETFRRVWKRVMPDETASPIVVHNSKRDTKSGQQSQTKQPKQPEGDGEILRQMLEMLDQGLAVSGVVVRRQPGAWPLRDSMQKSAAQTRSVWFLMNGQRWENSSRTVNWNVPLGHLLREQYIRELQFSQLCRDGGRQAQEETLREIVPELEQAARRRRGMIRNLLSSGRF